LGHFLFWLVSFFKVAGADDPLEANVGMLTKASAFESRPVRKNAPRNWGIFYFGLSVF
jgi:hypothetical protein